MRSTEAGGQRTCRTAALLISLLLALCGHSNSVGSTGILKQVPGSPTPPPSGFSGGTLQSLAAAPGSESLYIADSHFGEIYGYSISSNGALTFIGNIPSLGTAIGEPLWLSNDPAGGANLFDADADGGAGGSVSVFSIGVGGALTQVGVFGTGNTINNPVALAISPTLPFLYTANDLNGNVTQLTISSGGELNDAVLLPNYTNASSIAIDNLAEFAYVVDSPDALVFQNSIDQSTGALVALDPSSLATENPPNPSAAPFQLIAVETPSPS
jgi:6-phosphogluconolactonase (cycloisomerase 2 family)